MDLLIRYIDRPDEREFITEPNVQATRDGVMVDNCLEKVVNNDNNGKEPE